MGKFLKEKIFDFFDKISKWFLHRTFRKFHIVKLNLKPGFYDTDYRLEKAIFSLLDDYIKNSDRYKPDEDINISDKISKEEYRSFVTQGNAYRKLEKINNWYKEKKENPYDKQIDDFFDSNPNFYNKIKVGNSYTFVPKDKNKEKILNEIHLKSIKWEEEYENKLIEYMQDVIKLKKWLW